MAYFTKCEVCGELYDPQSTAPKRLTVEKDSAEKEVECCDRCYEKYKDGRDNFYHLLSRK